MVNDTFDAITTHTCILFNKVLFQWFLMAFAGRPSSNLDIFVLFFAISKRWGDTFGHKLEHHSLHNAAMEDYNHLQDTQWRVDSSRFRHLESVKNAPFISYLAMCLDDYPVLFRCPVCLAYFWAKMIEPSFPALLSDPTL